MKKIIIFNKKCSFCGEMMSFYIQDKLSPKIIPPIIKKTQKSLIKKNYPITNKKYIVRKIARRPKYYNWSEYLDHYHYYQECHSCERSGSVYIQIEDGYPKRIMKKKALNNKN